MLRVRVVEDWSTVVNLFEGGELLTYFFGLDVASELARLALVGVVCCVNVGDRFLKWVFAIRCWSIAISQWRVSWTSVEGLNGPGSIGRDWGQYLGTRFISVHVRACQVAHWIHYMVVLSYWVLADEWNIFEVVRAQSSSLIFQNWWSFSGLRRDQSVSIQGYSSLQFEFMEHLFENLGVVQRIQAVQSESLFIGLYQNKLVDSALSARFLLGKVEYLRDNIAHLF